MSLQQGMQEKWKALVDLGWLVLNGYSWEQIGAHRKGGTARFGFRSLRSIWIHGGTREAFISAGGVIEAMRLVASESCFVLTSCDPMVESWLRTRFPDDRVFTYPGEKSAYANRFLRNLSPKMILLLEEANGFHRDVWVHAKEQNIPIILIDGKEEKLAYGRLSHRCLREGSKAIPIENDRISPVTVTGSLAFESALLSTPVSAKSFCREAGVDESTSFVFVDRPGLMEEDGLLDALEKVRDSHPGLVSLWMPPSVRRLRRFEAALTHREIAFRHWGERSEGTPAVILLSPNLASVPFYSVCRAIIAGGSFSFLSLPGIPVEPVTRHAPVIYGPFLAKRADTARFWIKNQAARQCSLGELSALLESLINDDSQRESLLARVTGLLEPSRNATEKTMQAIVPFYPALPDERPSGLGWRKKKSREEREVLDDPAKNIEKIEVRNWEAFQQRIGNPRSILCLGNGPTSEDPQVVATPHDALFRANWRWMDRGLLTNPDVVFVGDPATIGKTELPCVFVFPDPERTFGGLRSTRITTRKAPIEHFTLTQSSCEWLAELAKDTHARPTNGVLMIATACALQPETLTIAGVDLFSHPDGRYPGDLQAVNAYATCHDSNNELYLIECALRQYRGKLVIQSPILVEALKQRGFPTDRLST